MTVDVCTIAGTLEGSTLAGTLEGSFMDGSRDEASFNCPTCIEVDSSGSVYVYDYRNYSLRKISPDGHVTTIAGDGHKAGSNVSEFDGRGEEARFRDVRSMTSDADGSLYVVDGTAIRRVSPAGDVATLAFRCNDVCKAIAIDGDGNFLVVEGRALIRFARDGTRTKIHTLFAACYASVAVDDAGTVSLLEGNEQECCLYQFRKDPHQFRKDHPLLHNRLAGGDIGFVDGQGIDARFGGGSAVAVDGDGNVLVADCYNHCVRMVSPQGDVSTLVGVPQYPGLVNGSGCSARFNQPGGIAVDGEGNVLVGDSLNHSIRKVHAHLTPPRRFDKQQPSVFRQDLLSVLRSGLMADTTIRVGGEQIAAHGIILAARSEHFATVLTSDFAEGAGRQIEIEDATPEGVRALLHYFYTDEVVAEDSVLLDLLQLAHRYRLERLYAECVRRCKRGLHLHNAIPQFLQCHAYRMEEVRAYTFHYIVRNFKRIRAAAKDTMALLADHPDLALELLYEVN